MSDTGVRLGVELLLRAVDRLVAESPVELPGAVALARCSALLVARERLGAAALAAVGDVDRRELFALDRAGSTRGWLRTQLGGDAGQLGQARRLAARPRVFAAQAAGELSGRAAGQVCAALEKVPDQVAEPTLEAALVDGLRSLLGRQLGLGLPEHLQPTAAHLALRQELAGVVGDALADTASAPAQRLEPALLLLARQIAPGQLGWALDYLLDALLPERIDPPGERDFYLDLTPVLDGEWDLRGHLDHETGALLAAELDRQMRAAEAAASAAADATGTSTSAGTGTGASAPTGAGAPVEPDHVTAPADRDPGSAFTDLIEHDRDPHASTSGTTLISKGRRRLAAFLQLLRDSADHQTGSGRPTPAALTIITTVEAVEARAGALPGMLLTAGKPVSLRPETLQRLGCFSELTAVLLDAAGRPVGASSTRRSASRRERAALAALWGPWCAVAGCTRTDTVPHHARPWWLTRQTRLRDLIPICDHDHRDLHEHHRTLRLEDGRLIDELGWVTDQD